MVKPGIWFSVVKDTLYILSDSIKYGKIANENLFAFSKLSDLFILSDAQNPTITHVLQVCLYLPRILTYWLLNKPATFKLPFGDKNL